MSVTRSIWLESWLRRRWWAVVGSALTVVIALANMFYWAPVVHGVNVWEDPGDIWNAVQAAHFIAWGDFGYLYLAKGLVSFPGFYIVLTPLAELAQHFHWTEGFPISLERPTALPWALGYSLLWSCVAVFAVDLLAERLGLVGRRRALGVLTSAALLWEATAMWGHPEDTISLGFAIFGLLEANIKQWKLMAWFFGFAIAFQPLAGILLLIALALAWRDLHKKVAGIALRAAALPLVLVAIPLDRDWADTSRSILSQPTYPTVGWRTPWDRLLRWTHIGIVPTYAQAPNIRCPTRGSKYILGLCHVAQQANEAARAHAAGTYVVNASHIRLGVIVIAVAASIWVAARREHLDLRELIWLCGAILAVRCLFEAVMFPYYITPALALLAVVSATSPWPQMVLGWIGCAGLLEYTWRHGPEWRWYLILAGLILATLAVTFPSENHVWSGYKQAAT